MSHPALYDLPPSASPTPIRFTLNRRGWSLGFGGPVVGLPADSVRLWQIRGFVGTIDAHERSETWNALQFPKAREMSTASNVSVGLIALVWFALSGVRRASPAAWSPRVREERPPHIAMCTRTAIRIRCGSGGSRSTSAWTSTVAS